jgi:hypothetical protein
MAANFSFKTTGKYIQNPGESKAGLINCHRRISLSCNLSLAPGFSPVGAGDAAPSRFNGFVAAGAENG